MTPGFCRSRLSAYSGLELEIGQIVVQVRRRVVLQVQEVFFGEGDKIVGILF